MNSQKLTQKSVAALEAAHAEVVRRKHSELTTLHLLHALVTQEQGLVPRLLDKLDVEVHNFSRNLENQLERLPTFSGANLGQVSASGDFNHALVAAEDEAKRLDDEYVSVEHLLLALLKRGR